MDANTANEAQAGPASELTSIENGVPAPRPRIDAVDIAKFVLSIMIVCVHIQPLGSYNVYAQPLLRTAVPLFFMISSYFFFKKQMKARSFDERVSMFEKFAKRNLQLYAFWFVALLVPTLQYRRWFDDGLLLGLFELANNFLFHSTFIASWYIMASIIATAAIVALSRHMGNASLLALFAPIYVVCCLTSNYAGTSFMVEHSEAFSYAFSAPYNSFWVALFWILLGKIAAERQVRLRGIETRWLILALAAGLALLAVEQAVIVHKGFAGADDCFLSLPLVCAPTFLLILRANVTCRHAAFLRAASTVTYCLHDTLNVTLTVLLGLSLSAPVVFLLALAASWLLTAAILKLERKRGLAWLRFAH